VNINKKAIIYLLLVFTVLSGALMLAKLTDSTVVNSDLQETPIRQIAEYSTTGNLIEFEKIYALNKVAENEQLSKDLQETFELERKKNVHYVQYQGPIEHLFFHPLIAFPELAFDNDYMTKGYDDYFVTVSEFTKIIEALYKNNYILVNIQDIYDPQLIDGNLMIRQKELFLPEGKKPLILSIDDLNYYEYMRENGNVYKLILDPYNRIATYAISPTGEEVISRTNEIIPLLDDFVNAHEDFSFQGAKGIIALTGYEGILGYRTNELGSPNYSDDKEAALKVVNRLKETGWTFASHGYGHLDVKKISYNLLVKDTKRWQAEVGSLIGETDVYIYPFGSSVLPPSEKFNYLVETGFPVLCSVGPNPYLQLTEDYLMMDRRHIDGIALKTQRERLLSLFDSLEIIDPIRP